jgi:hypothetical protein
MARSAEYWRRFLGLSWTKLPLDRLLAETVGLCRSRLRAIPPSLAKLGTALRIFLRASCASDARWSNQCARPHTRTPKHDLGRRRACLNHVWRRGWDSNPRSPARGTTDFESAPIDHSGTSPSLCYFTRSAPSHDGVFCLLTVNILGPRAAFFLLPPLVECASSP